MTATDDWNFPAVGSEAGINYADLGDGVKMFDVRGAWSDGFGTGGPVEKIGYTAHHSVTGVGDGSLAGDLALIQAIHAYHVNNNGWPGIGYHRVIGSGRRLYFISSSDKQRAHVANLNHQWIGWCFLGDWSHQRPDEDRMAAFKRGLQWETDQRGVPMLLAPHKRLTPGTECPGGWAPVDAWQGLVLQPAPPAPPPIPDPVPTGYDDFTRGRIEVFDAVIREEEVHLAHMKSRREAWGIPTGGS